MDGTIGRLLEGLAAGGLEGLAAAGFYMCFFGSGRGAVLAGAGIGVFSLAVFWQPGLAPGILALSAVWMILAGRIYQTGQWKELFLAGGVWLIIRSLACLWPDSAPLQTVSALALFGMAALYLLGRGRLYLLWMATLVCLWLLGGFFGGMAYGEVWQEQVMKAASYLVLGGIIVFQQIFCIRQEARRGIWEETGKETSGGELNDWRKAADQELRRLRIFEHDFRHHLDMLGALYEEGNRDEARAYLEDLKQARLSGQGMKIGGERELSYLMMAKKEACRKAGIQFSCQILGSPRGIAQMDMTALVLNLLDNAIRACEKASEPRNIGIMLLARGDLWQIELVNTGLFNPGKPGRDRCQECAELEGTEPGDRRQLHGIGLISVRQIVEKYQGVFEIRQEGNSVVQKLILTGRPPE